MKRPKVKLRNAFLWDCPACSASNVDEQTPLAEEIARDVAEEYGGEPSDYGAMPTRVMCSGCRLTFPVWVDEPADSW